MHLCLKESCNAEQEHFDPKSDALAGQKRRREEGGEDLDPAAAKVAHVAGSSDVAAAHAITGLTPTTPPCATSIV